MTTICYHASHEQFAPSELLRLVQLAEQAGFEGIHSSDHFHPWSVRQGQSGFTFSWIAAALQATSLPFSMVCTPGQRLHPAIVAQAVATLNEMFPGRLNLELGTGEALNEHITGEPWPDKPVRNDRLLECYQVIKKLLNGEEVSHDGLVKVKEAKLYTLPKKEPLLLCAALSEATSKWAGTWADGLLTTTDSKEVTGNKVKAFRSNGGEGKPVYLQYSFSYAKTKEEAIDIAWHQWRSNMVGMDELASLYKTEHYDAAGEKVEKKEIEEKIHIITDPEELWENINVYEDLNIDRISLHNINTDHDDFIKSFGEVIKKRKAAELIEVVSY
jgi:coenzyme F420-dependent glucose-6-phosphate dehydrogenase